MAITMNNKSPVAMMPEAIDMVFAYKGIVNVDPGTIGINGQKNGWYVKGGYMLPTVPLQFFGRYEKWNFANLNDVYDQEIDWYGVGANYYFRDQNLKLTAEVSRTAFETEAPDCKDFTTFVTQLQLIF
jgi:hypothetical protein